MRSVRTITLVRSVHGYRQKTYRELGVASAGRDKAPLKPRARKSLRKIRENCPQRLIAVTLCFFYQSDSEVFIFAIFIAPAHHLSSARPCAPHLIKNARSLFRSRARRKRILADFSLHLRDFSFAQCWRLLTVVIRRRRKNRKKRDELLIRGLHNFRKSFRRSRLGNLERPLPVRFRGNRNRVVELPNSLHAAVTAGTMCDQCMVKFLSFAVASVHKHADYFLSNQL